MKWNWRPLCLKCWHFVASDDSINKFKSQGLYTKKIKYWNASGSGFPPSLIPALWNIGILHHKKVKLRKLMRQSVHSWGFLGWATTWGNWRVSQSFWVLENNSVVLKSLFCRIVWCEIQSYRKATCNFVVLTFIEKNKPPWPGIEPGTIRSEARRSTRWAIEA